MSNDKHKIFISYSQFDDSKVQIIKKELQNNRYFTPVIIASNREAAKLLTHKVSEGIKDANIVIPILTSNSIGTQWINQEIGFASALEIPIKPIIEIEILNDLKGFIHNKIDLPYSYGKSDNKAKESKDFKRCFRQLISDLEVEFNLGSRSTIDETPTKPSLDDIVNQINEKKERILQREIMLKSKLAIEEADRSVSEIFKIVRAGTEILRTKGISLPQDLYSPNGEATYILQSDQHSFSIRWKKELKYNERTGDCILNNSKLLVHLADGQLIKNEAGKIPKPPRMTTVRTYEIDVRDNLQTLAWKLDINKQFYSNNDIAQYCLNWIIEKINETIVSV